MSQGTLEVTPKAPKAPPPSARTITAELMARLRRHYIKPGPMPGGVFVPEVGENGATGSGQRCDALYVGFTSSSGRLLIGHEVKATRADWLHELDQPEKADRWADQCHEWYLVTVPGVVQDGELPAGWGLMLPGKSTTRMDRRVAATRYPDRTPSWQTVRSLIARLDTLQDAELRDMRAKARDDARKDADAALDAAVKKRLGQTGIDAERLAEFDRIFGHVRPADLEAFAALYFGEPMRDLRYFHRTLIDPFTVKSIDRLRRACDEYEEAMAAALAAAPVEGSDGA